MTNTQWQPLSDEELAEQLLCGAKDKEKEIRNAALEEAAQIANAWDRPYSYTLLPEFETGIAKAIRRLKR